MTAVGEGSLVTRRARGGAEIEKIRKRGQIRAIFADGQRNGRPGSRRRALAGAFRSLSGDTGAGGPAQPSNVLHRGDDPVLDLLPPESAPAGTFEVIVIRRVREAAFHQMRTAPAIRVRFGQACKRQPHLERFLPPVSRD